MQKSSNIEKEVNTDEEHLHLPPAISPGISDPEQQPSPKVKTRSRFSSAIRKLSGSGRKKKSREQPKEIVAETQVVSSGGEENPSDVPKEFSPLLEKKDKKKGKLSKRFLGLGKPSKQVTPDNIDADYIRPGETSNLDDSKSIEISKTREVTSEHEHTIRTPDITEISPTTSANSSPRRLDRIQKVQITISGKKIEHTKIDAKQRSITTTTTQITGGSRSETDYLIPNPIAELQDPPTTTTVTTIISGTSEPLKVIEDNSIKVRQKSITRAADKQELTSATSKQDKTTAVEKNTTPIKSTSERVVVITQSSRDTPPREVAPIKPSNSGETEEQSPTTPKTNTGTVSKKTSARTALALPTITQKFKNKSPKSKNKSGKVISPSVEKTNLMQNSPVIEQRGHRFPAPSTTSEVDESESPKIEFRAESHASPSPVVNTKEWQSQQSNASTEPPNYPPPSVPSSSNSSSPINTTLAAAPIATTTAIESTAPLADIRESVLTVSSSALDDIVSSAESVVVPGNNIKNNKNTLGPRQPIDLASSVLFVHKESRVDSLDSKDSDSDVSDTNRKRIHYIEQPSLTEEELTSLERRRESFKYHTEVSVREFTLDSSNEDSVDIEIPKMPAFGDLTMDQEMEPTIMTSANAEKREHLYKILVIGELGTGKTSFIKRYVHQFFSQNYRATIGVDFALKVLHWDANTIVRLQLWDIAGQERFGNMTRVYYKEAVGAFIVFDVTRSGTFECVSKWKEDLDSKVQLPDGSPIPCILLANKCDQDKQGIVTSPDKMEEYVRENCFAGWFETSAKENMNIDEAARALVNKILLNDKLISAADLADSEKFNLNLTGDQTASESKSKCSC